MFRELPLLLFGECEFSSLNIHVLITAPINDSVEDWADRRSNGLLKRRAALACAAERILFRAPASLSIRLTKINIVLFMSDIKNFVHVQAEGEFIN